MNFIDTDRAIKLYFKPTPHDGTPQGLIKALEDDDRKMWTMVDAFYPPTISQKFYAFINKILHTMTNKVQRIIK